MTIALPWLSKITDDTCGTSVAFLVIQFVTITLHVEILLPKISQQTPPPIFLLFFSLSLSLGPTWTTIRVAYCRPLLSPPSSFFFLPLLLPPSFSLFFYFILFFHGKTLAYPPFLSSSLSFLSSFPHSLFLPSFPYP